MAKYSIKTLIIIIQKHGNGRAEIGMLDGAVTENPDGGMDT
jgi:hypothetical protein